LKQTLLILFIFLAWQTRTRAQAQPDSIYFNLYTDSLKKGTHNYISVDGKYSNGRYLPLDSKAVNFTATAGRFEGNSLVLPIDFTEEKVTITATLKAKPQLTRTITLYIKKKADDEKLKTPEEILRDLDNGNKKPADTSKPARKRRRG
jgi:hypothetical protein